MISTQYPTAAEFEDAVHATAYMATALLRRGELLLPPRIREHIADGPVVVHLLRGDDDVARYEATLTAGSKLVGIDWPEDVLPQTSLVVLCPRGGASHDVAVQLPDLPEPTVTFLGPVPDEEPEPVDDGLCEKCVAPYVDDPEGLGLCRQHLTDHYDAEAAAERQADDELDEDALDEEPTSLADTDALVALLADQLTAAPVVETPLPGPAEYEVPTTLRPPADEPTETIPAVEQTAIIPAVGVIKWPAEEPAERDVTEDAEPGTVFSAALVAVRSQALVARQEPPRRAGWLERRVREGARLVLDRSWTATRVIVATASGLVLSGAGLGYVVLAVFQ